MFGRVRDDERSEMFGRVRATSSSPDILDRPPSKILKDDSLSIYEATLMKLKLGSQRDLSSSCEKEVVDMESDCSSASFSGSCAQTMALEPNSTSTDVLKSSQHLITSPNEQDSMMMDTDSSSATVCPYVQDPNQHCSRNSSVLDLFSKYNNSRRQSASTDAVSTAINSSSSGGFPSTVNCHSSVSTKGRSEFECLSSSSSLSHVM